jgi:YegS/Rv2252/BmrU family lipid kinase
LASRTRRLFDSRTRRALGRLDRRLLAAAIRRRSPVTNRVLTTASTAANRSVLWVAIAATLTATGRRRPRSAAASGLLGIAISSTLVNGPLKFAWRRERPPTLAKHDAPLLPLPRTFSFPSGHAASALAFAAGATRAMPACGPVVVPLAGAVAYSRVHTGVHYPSDVVVGGVIGAASGLVGARVVGRLRDSSVHHVDGPELDIAVPRRAVLVVSEDSGSADGLGRARRALENAGWSVEDVVTVHEIDRLTSRLRDGGEVPVVIAAGGDGTVCVAANAVHGTGALLGIVPLGTSNDVARSFGIPPDPVEAVGATTSGTVRAVDAGRLRVADADLVFLNAVTAGLNVEFAREATAASLRERLGRLSYPVAAARALRAYEPFECTIESDGRSQTFSAVHLSISNAPVFGGLLGMRVPGASLTDGLLDVTVVERLSGARLAVAVADAFVGRHRPVPGVHTMRVRSLRVDARGPQKLALDGELIGELPAEFEVQPGALRVVVPAG